MGNPDGGWYDDDPPRVLYATPAEQSTNVTDKKINIYFDEFIKLEDPTQNVIVSPPQLEMPEIKTAGKKIVIELVDSLIPNTTYTIDFSNAISDNNENNPMGNYTYTFSTGERIDTFEVAGYVIDAQTLEPVKGISVGLYDNLADSVFRTQPLMRISRTDSRGHFVIKGVAPGEYRVYALQDADGDYRFSQKSEMIAFNHSTYKPTAGPDVRQDTIWRDTLHIDNILQVPYTHFYPDDIVMLAFQEEQTDRYLLKQPERIDANRMTLYFSYGNPQLPVIKGLDFNADSAFVLEASAKKDTLNYWLRDTALVNRDTLTISLEYLKTDSLGQLVSQTDTLEVLAKTPYAKRQKELNKEMEKWQKEQDKKKKQGEPYDSIYPILPLEPQIAIPGTMTPTSRIPIVMPTPLEKLDTAAIHLYSKIDTLWYRAPFVFQRRDSMLRHFEIIADWHPDTEYSLEIDTMAFIDIYGKVSDPYKQGLKVKSPDEFSTLELQLSGAIGDNMIVALLDKNGKVLQQQQMAADHSVVFYYVKPGIYYASAFNDRNNNGVWDTGLYDEDRQPEEVYYYPDEIECKEKWDITKSWNVTAKPLNQQKPAALIKQKGNKEKKKLQNRNAERAQKLGIQYVKKEPKVKEKKDKKKKEEEKEQ
jgi:uncharacterized protein (DUF2141 family)